MKLRRSTQTNRAFNAFEVLVIVAAVLLLAALLLSLTGRVHHVGSGMQCVDNLRQVSEAFEIWQSDNSNTYPMGVSVTNGGAMEAVATGNATACFGILSNYLSTPLALYCPADTNHTLARSFGPGFDRSHASYFVNAAVTNVSDPRSILVGDDDLIAGGLPVKSGLAVLSTNQAMAWSGNRHEFGGNFGFADGSVVRITAPDLQRMFVQTDVATNRLAIP